MKKNLFILLIVVLLAGALPISALAEDITIDIKPDDEDNILAVNRKSALPVAIYNGEGLIDISTVYLEGVPVTSYYEKLDYLLVKFDTAALLVAIGDVEDGDVITLTLVGEKDGEEFEVTDFVTIRARGN